MTQGAAHTSRSLLDNAKPKELVLVIDSFSGGENTEKEDLYTAANEARVIKNWESLSIGGMQRVKGFQEIANGGGSYSSALDLLIHHDEGSSEEVYGICEGDLIRVNGSTLTQEDASAFTSGVLSYGLSAGDNALWITNATDGLKRKEISSAISTPSSVPSENKERIYEHKFRLIAEGGNKTIKYSRAGKGNWTASDAWTATNDAASLDFPSDTKGCVPGFPSGDGTLVFTRFSAYLAFNAPNVTYQEVPNSIGCVAPYSIAKGDEGVFFLSDSPTLGVYLFTGSTFVQLSEYNDFVEEIDLDQRVYGFYRNRKYHIIYNKKNSGVTYPNKMMIYNTRFGRWMERSVNTTKDDNFGYPALLKENLNEIYISSSRSDVVYELESGESDGGETTQASYKTKDFSSIDLRLNSGNSFPIDDVRLKLYKITATAFGTLGSFSVAWTSDRGKRTGSQTFQLSGEGDELNTTFTLNTSLLSATPADKTESKTVSNNAVGRRFNFEIINSGTGTRPIVKRLKFHFIPMEEG